MFAPIGINCLNFRDYENLSSKKFKKKTYILVRTQSETFLVSTVTDINDLKLLKCTKKSYKHTFLHFF